MKLAFCLFKYFPYGGMQDDFLQTALACLRRGHQVRVYTMQWQGDRPAGLDINIIPVSSFSNHGRYQKFAKAVQQALIADPVDVTIGFNKIPGLDLYFAADPCFVERAQKKYPWYVRLLNPRYRLLAAFERSVFGVDSKTQIFYISEKEKQKITQVYQIPESRFTLMPPGIAEPNWDEALSAANRVALRQQLNLDEHTVVLLFVGSGFKIKGLDRAITAVASLPETVLASVKLLVVGDAEPGQYQAQAEKLGIAGNIHFLGGRNDVAELMHSADYLIHPARNETGGKVLLEAASNGLPVLTTAACGFAHYIAEADMGYVLDEPFQQVVLNQQLAQCLGELDRKQSQQRAHAFNATTDIFSLAERMAEHIEAAGAAS